MEGFVDSIRDYKYLDKWEKRLTGKEHLPRHIKFHDNAAIWARFQSINANDVGVTYYRHWLACQQAYGAGNEDCQKIRWWAQKVGHPIHLAEWDDWWRDEHYDIQIGQHWNRICGEEFEEASNMLKEVKEKREGLVAKFRELLKNKAADDPMGKILQEITELEEPSKTPVTDLLEAGKISQEDIEAAAATKIKELNALKDDTVWADIKAELLPQLTATCLKLKTTAKVVAEIKAAAEEDTKRTDGIKARVPHMKLSYEKPGMYEYHTWFGKFLPRTPQFGFPEAEEE